MSVRGLVPSSASNRILDSLNKDRGLSDEEIARMICVEPRFIGMVRLRELPLTIELLERMAEGLGLRLGGFLLSTMSHREPKTPAAAEAAERCAKSCGRPIACPS